MKTHFENRQVAHVWASQRQPEGKGSNFFFENETIYSYGRHFPIARFVSNGTERAILFTSRSYSVSTSKHISYTRNAIHGLGIKVFSVVNPDQNFRSPEHKRNWEKKIAEALEGFVKPRIRANTREAFMQSAIHAANDANEFAHFFELDWRIEVPTFDSDTVETLRLAKTAQIHAEKENEAARERARKLQRELDIKDFYEGIGQHYNLTDDKGGALLRISDDGLEVQTSRGASVPVKEARTLLRSVKAAIAQKKCFTFSPGTAHIGHFDVREIMANGDIQIGCHFIQWEQIARIEAALKTA